MAYDADEILARMRADEASDWPDRLLDAIEQARVPTLSHRQRRALELASYGMTTLETSVLLDASQRSINDLMREARWKLGAKTTTHAVALALRRGLIV